MACKAAIFVFLMCTSAVALNISPRAYAKRCLQPVTETEGSGITVSNCNGNSLQEWTLADGKIRLADGMCLDMTDGKVFEGAKPQIWKCFDNNDNQKWAVQGGSLSLQNSNKCITGGNTHGVALHIITCNSKDSNQKWIASKLRYLDIPVTSVDIPVQVWLSSADLSISLQRQTDIVLGTGGNNNLPTVVLDPNNKKQPIEGFGASITDSSAYLINQKLASRQIEDLMVKLFDPTYGIGLSVLRQPMGASDFSHVGSYSYNDGAVDPTLSRFSIAHDKIDIIPLLKRAYSINKMLIILAVPWSPPGWMKTSASLNGGYLVRNAFGPLAQYFVKFIKAYVAQGLPIWGVSPQNEPQLNTNSYPSMSLNATDETTFVNNYLVPALAHAKLTTKILGYDHNACEQTTNQCPAVYPANLLNAAANNVYGIAWHCYNGDLSYITGFHNVFPNTPLYMTECSGGSWQNGTPSYLHAELWLLFSALNNWMRTVITWNLALDQSGGPTNGGCLDCRGVVTVNSDNGDVTYNAEYYALGHMSKFWRRGAYVVTVTSGVANLNTVAYQNTNGQNVLLVENVGNVPSFFGVKSGSYGFTTTVPVGAAVTYIWTPPTVS